MGLSACLGRANSASQPLSMAAALWRAFLPFALMWGWWDIAFVLLLSFLALLRPAEALALSVQDVLPPSLHEHPLLLRACPYFRAAGCGLRWGPASAVCARLVPTLLQHGRSVQFLCAHAACSLLASALLTPTPQASPWPGFALGERLSCTFQALA